MKYVYTGWGPETGPEGELVRPLDEREFDKQPTWGRWAAIVPVEPESAPVPEPEPAAARDAAIASHLAVTPPALAAQGIVAKGM